MVVLVNGGSASASEIVAVRYKDYKRATIMGSQTYGKGSVQTVIPLDKTTGMKLTIARYYTPSGKSIQARGVILKFYDDTSQAKPVDTRASQTYQVICPTTAELR